ncbi:hypothetical protein MRX96_022086 [Rhipicephalus microplus]
MWIEGSSSNTGCGRFESECCHSRCVPIILFTSQLNETSLSLGGLCSGAPVECRSNDPRRIRDVSRLGWGHDSPVLPGLAGEEERPQMTEGMIV